MIILKYRKKHYYRGYPWSEVCDGPVEAMEFIEKLGEDYDVIPFMEMDIQGLEDMAVEAGWEEKI